ncbi:MAG: molybdopterin cofactor-binding domain-containing protein [Gemmatimonadales bacterium]
MDRRRFVRLVGGAGAGLTLAVWLDGCAGPDPVPTEGAFVPNAWLELTPDGTITVVVDRAEMGQGVSTSLPMLVAEELDADWSRVRFRFAPAHRAYDNPLIGAQVTGGSTSIRAAWEPLRRAGATARAMLVSAAAAGWGVDPSGCVTADGVVSHPASGRSAGYGELAARAAAIPLPDAVPLKEPGAFRLIGRSPPRLDIPDKTTGRAEFGLDAGPRDALVAVVARCPVFGGRLDRFDPAPALAVAGVVAVERIESGVAIVAEHTWAALRGREALDVSWREGSGASLSDLGLRQEREARLLEPGRVLRSLGDPDGVTGATTVEATYQLPYLAHATMEPINCTASVDDAGVTVWVPTQFQSAAWYFAGGGARGVAAKAAGVSADRARVVSTMLGGGFGRRFELDAVREAVQISKAVGRPVRLVWTREDDVRHDFYRPAATHRLVGALDQSGTPVLWRHHVVAQSVLRRFLPAAIPDWTLRLALGDRGPGTDVMEGAGEMPYAIRNLAIGFSEVETTVPVGYWRSVGHSHTAFAVESFIDELAHAAGKDPVRFRLDLLTAAPRHRRVLETVAALAGWDQPAAPGRFRGVAVHESFGSIVGQVAELSVDEGKIRVHRVWCAIDCGRVVHPDTVVAQMESGIVFGLTAALYGEITIEGGRVQQSNFHDYPVLRIDETPQIEVAIVPSEHAPGGVGEPGTPPIAPAVANALFQATGVRSRSLPLRV